MSEKKTGGTVPRGEEKRSYQYRRQATPDSLQSCLKQSAKEKLFGETSHEERQHQRQADSEHKLRPREGRERINSPVATAART
jgi:hypothetical protein